MSSTHEIALAARDAAVALAEAEQRHKREVRVMRRRHDGEIVVLTKQMTATRDAAIDALFAETQDMFGAHFAVTKQRTDGSGLFPEQYIAISEPGAAHTHVLNIAASAAPGRQPVWAQVVLWRILDKAPDAGRIQGDRFDGYGVSVDDAVLNLRSDLWGRSAGASLYKFVSRVYESRAGAEAPPREVALGDALTEGA